jgi:hypothetical protein
MHSPFHRYDLPDDLPTHAAVENDLFSKFFAGVQPTIRTDITKSIDEGIQTHKQAVCRLISPF